MNPEEREAMWAWDVQADLAEQHEIWVGEQIAQYWSTVTNDDLKIAFAEDCENSEAINAALVDRDNAALGHECRRAINAYFAQNAEIDWECKNG